MELNLSSELVGRQIANWSELLPELLEEIARRTSSIEDFFAFKGVCTAWRSATTHDKFGQTSRVPLLILVEKDGSDDLKLYSLLKKRIGMRIKHPEPKDKKLIRVGFGWLLTFSNSGEVNLLNLISRAQIRLPNYKTFPNYQESSIKMKFPGIQRAVLSDNPSYNSSSLMLFLILNKMLGYWRMGDKYWTRMPTDRFDGICDIKYNNKKLYIAFHESIVVWDSCESDDLKIILQTDINTLLIQAKFSSRVSDVFYMQYLLESSHGNLLLITRVGLYNVSSNESYRSSCFETIGFVVMQVDVVKGEYKIMKSLENDSIFLDISGAISISIANIPDMIKPNCIYFTDEFSECPYDEKTGWKFSAKDMRIYKIHEYENATIESFNVDFTSLVCFPQWIVPSL